MSMTSSYSTVSDVESVGGDQNKCLTVNFIYDLIFIRRGRNVLKIDGSSGPEELEFLSENDTGPTGLFSDSSSSSAEKSPADTGINEKQAGSAPTSTDDRRVSGGGPGYAAASPDSGDKVAQLQSLGFSKEVVEQALIQADGDVDLAANLLLSSR